MGTSSLIFINIVLLNFFYMFSDATDILTSSEFLGDGRTLVSKEGMFELGFFSPGNSKGHYLGIWYKKIPLQTVVWVANRQNPITDSSGFLSLNKTGNLLLQSRSNGVVWSSNTTNVAQNPTVQLLDSGNLVIRCRKDGNSETVLWQSFDYPTDTLLPGMKVGWDLRTGLDRRLSAWKSSDDPSPGEFTSGIELYSYPEFVAWKGSKKYMRKGPWNGLKNSGAPTMTSCFLFQPEFVWNKDEVYFTYHLKNKSVITRYVLNQTSYPYQGQRYIWSEESRTWLLSISTPRDNCDYYGKCGAYGSCDIKESQVCQCLKGFKPRSPQHWDSMDWSHGCVRNKPINCLKGDGFIKFSGLKLPDTTHSWVDKSIGLKECRAKCLENCSCMAYTNADIREGSGCAIWFGELIDIKVLHDDWQDLYIRMSASEIESKGETKLRIAATTSAIMFIACCVVLAYGCIYRPQATTEGRKDNRDLNDKSNAVQKEDTDFQVFNLAILAKATNNFSFENKLGEGGFGPVYRGTMVDGQEIAVKRLSRSSTQGSHELKNETALIAKLQHRNLVKLLGCCIEGDEQMLVYEFLPNKSLDFFIFDKRKSRLLDWSKRFHIICGVARGLVYLHQDSRLRVIHRDLKSSNVLLDTEMNPKIADFGLAKTFIGDQTEGSTNRVIGTYGYMAPEFAIDGTFSVKSDVFSFGILILEIISGKKNRGFYHPTHNLNLIGHAWELWKEGRPLQLIDSFLEESCSLSEVVRCIHIGLLCLQQHPEDRPSMASVVLMLGSETELIQPKEPGFLIDRKSLQTYTSTSMIESSSTNDITISLLEPR